jgi:hypothetical protein
VSRPPVPAAIKRQLRQESGFGCCICGLPIYQYHHVVPWEDEHHMRPEDMMLLCPNHHDAATKGALTEAQQRSAKSDPHNISEGLVTGHLAVNQPYLAVVIGGVLMVGDGPLIAVDDEPVLVTRPGTENVLELSARLYDEGDRLIAEIEDNEWIAGDPLPWDMESDHQRLLLRSALYKVTLDVDARKEPVRLRGRLWRHGRAVNLRPSGVQIGAAEAGVSFADLGIVRAGLNVDTAGNTLQIKPLGGQQWAFVSESDPTRRLINSVQAFYGLTTGVAPVLLRAPLAN